MTAAEYLAWEREQAVKHEFHEGEVFAMADGTLRHSFLGPGEEVVLTNGARLSVDAVFAGAFALPGAEPQPPPSDSDSERRA